MEIHALFLGIPLLLVILLVAMIWSRKGPHPATYKMSESWTHPPILWAATDEVVGHPEAPRAAPRLGDHDQWTDLGRHRTR
jgi:hypothetical protein